MVHLLPAAVSPPCDRTCLDATDLALSPAIVPQIVFKLAQALPKSQSIAPAEISPAITAAVHQLVQIISQLRSSEARPEARPEAGVAEASEVNSTQPLTPDILAPYVQEEADDVLAALQAHAPQSDKSDKSDKSGKENALSPTYVWLKNLAPWLLWGVGRSSYNLMRLMEGQIAWLKEEDQESGADQQQPGVLRLMALLHLQTPQFKIWIDLATYQPVTSMLAPEAMVQWHGMGVKYPAKAVSTWLEEMMDQVQTLSPIMAPFLQGMPVDLLIPQQTWATGTLQLQLALEFVPEFVPEFMPMEAIAHPVRMDAPGSASSSSASSSSASSEFPALGLSLPRLQITQPDWLEQYTQALQHQQFLCLLHHFPMLYELTDRATPPSLTTLVTHADAFAQLLQTNPLLNTRGLLQQDLSLADLAAWLLWNLMHSAYEVMQWVSGSSVSLLQPEAPYQVGNLRFVVILKLVTSEQEWLLDLATGQTPTSATLLLSSEAIVQSSDHEWCQQPQVLEQLSQQIWQHLDQITPEIRQLQQGATIELMTEEGTWQVGVLQLATAFEFVSSEHVFRELVLG